MPTQPTSNLPPPESWQELESIVVDIVREVWEDPIASRYGRKGQPDEGVDIVCNPSNSDGYYGIQVKNRDDVSIEMIKKEVEKTDQEFDPNLEKYILATSKPTDKYLQEEVRELSQYREEQGKCPVRIWMWKDICLSLARYHSLLEVHYPQYSKGGVRLEDEGVIRFNPAYFDTAKTRSIEQAWRMGFRPVDAAQGYIIDRTRACDEGRQSVTTQVLKHLHDGQNQIILGSAGSGKSSICMAVAHEWYVEGCGDVFYRRAGYRAFESVEYFEKEIEKAEGHVLVVFEDALRDEANSIFQLVNKASLKSSNVTFLFDSRINEYRTLDPAPVDSALSGEVRRIRDQLNPVYVPEVDATECQRIVTTFKELSEKSYSISSDEIYPHLDGNDIEGNILYLAYHLISGQEGRSGLENDVLDKVELIERQRENSEIGNELNDYDPDLVEQVAFAINLINIAPGVRLRREYLYVAVLGTGTSDDHQIIEDLLTGPLDGWLVLENQDGSLESVHELWSFLYLRYLIKGDESVNRDPLLTPRVAHQRFANIVEGIEKLFLDEELRANLLFWSRDEEFLNEIEDNPVSIAEWTLRYLYRTVTEWPILSPIFEPFGKTQVSISSSSLFSDSLVDRVDIILGHGYRKTGGFEKAEEKFDVDYRSLSPDNTNSQTIEKAYGLCSVYLSKGEFDDAKKYADKLVDILDRNGQPSDFARFEEILGTIEWKRSNFESAKAKYESALEIYREKDSANGKASALNKLGEIYRLTGEIGKAEEYYRDSLKIKQKHNFREGIITSLNGLGQVARARGDVEQAINYYTRSLDICKEIGHREAEATTLNNLGLIYRIEGDMDKTLEYHEKSLEIREEIDDKEGIAESTGNIGTALLGKGKLEEAKKYLQESLKNSKELENTNALAHIHSDLGSLHKEEEEYGVAYNLYKKCLRMSKRVGNRSLIAQSLNNMGNIFIKLEKLNDAEELLKKSIEVYEEVGDMNGMVTSLNNLGSVYRKSNNLDKAESHYLEAIETCKENGLVRKEAGCRHNLGGVYISKEEFQKARDEMKKAQTITEDFNDQPSRANILYNLGVLSLEEDDPLSEAREYLEESYEIFQEIGAPEAQAMCLARLSNIEYRCGNLGRADKYSRELFEISGKELDGDSNKSLLGRSQDQRW